MSDAMPAIIHRLVPAALSIVLLAQAGCQQQAPPSLVAQVAAQPVVVPVTRTSLAPATPTADQIPAQPPAEAALTEAAPAETQVAQIAPAAGVDPFTRKLKAPEFPQGLGWLNTPPLTKADVKGKFVLLDFWTYCCINCIHILPELKKLEKEFPNELVVIGVHSAKFDTEKDLDNIREAVLRYEIKHPVVNDAEHQIWDTYGVSSWPTILMMDPEGNAVWGRSGEFKAEQVREILKAAIPYYRANKLLDEKPFPLTLESENEDTTPLRFPGKIFADEAGGRLFITDSNHNRIVIATLAGQLLDTIGSGQIGRADGDFKTASFDHPQGVALHGETLYVADTENHLLRKVDLQSKAVTTIAGVGSQAAHGWPGLDEANEKGVAPSRWVGLPKTTALNSPWALWVHKNDLYIAMAGPHQIWKMPLDEREIGPYAGNGREDIVDGRLLPKVPYTQGFSSFAQPSGLASDGDKWLYVADSEGSSIRAVPFDPRGQVKTVVGSDQKDFGRLFDFGDKDGPRNVAKLQHCLEVVYLQGKIYVADTYNHKIKVVDAKTGETKTIAGTGLSGTSDDPPQFHEPAGLAHAKGLLYVADTNNHLIRTIDLASGAVKTLVIEGLDSPHGKRPAAAAAVPAAPPKKPGFKGAAQEKLKRAAVKPADGNVKLAVSLQVPAGWKMNLDAPMSYWLDSPKENGPVDRAAFGRTKLAVPTSDFEVTVPVTAAGDDEVAVSLNYYYCEDKPNGLCKYGAVVFTVPLKIANTAAAAPVKLVHAIPE